jgi:hypothetical protein
VLFIRTKIWTQKKEGGLLDRDYRKKQKAYTVFLKWGVLSQWFLRRLKSGLFTAVSTKLKELFPYEPATSYTCKEFKHNLLTARSL